MGNINKNFSGHEEYPYTSAIYQRTVNMLANARYPAALPVCIRVIVPI